MCNKYPNKKKRRGFWKRYERANIKDYRKVWDFCIDIIDEDKIPFVFSNAGRKPNLSRKEYVCMSILHAYFDLDFRETEQLAKILSGKQLDHTNCVRWFGKLNVDDEPELAARFGVMSIPTFLLVKNGNEIGRFVGTMPKSAFKNKIEQVWNA